ncbi:hypothetical protein GGX14DRAFT_575894 [Mycena pura]|uniref:Uncharacterized protein n=1 Tax=Mycena pura TaxID=153505 RepID=A0AAD6Y5K1_9AGAR|nr:hypothetical protein GGX14DRAFT_575894 [Mycena pura]
MLRRRNRVASDGLVLATAPANVNVPPSQGNAAVGAEFNVTIDTHGMNHATILGLIRFYNEDRTCGPRPAMRHARLTALLAPVACACYPRLPQCLPDTRPAVLISASSSAVRDAAVPASTTNSNSAVAISRAAATVAGPAAAVAGLAAAVAGPAAAVTGSIVVDATTDISNSDLDETKARLRH